DGMSEVIGNTTLKTIEKVEDGKQIAEEVITESKQKAEEVITESKQKAEEVITESKQKADDMIVDMIAAGEEYREGYQESVATGKQALADMKDELEAAILHMQNSLKYHRVFGVGRVLDSLAKFDREKYQDLLDKIKRHVV
nr:hypothetical protein [Lachnospiraceae bacterium]